MQVNFYFTFAYKTTASVVDVDVHCDMTTMAQKVKVKISFTQLALPLKPVVYYSDMQVKIS